MKVKELYKKYKDYAIILYGKNRYYDLKECINKSIPFSYIHTTNKKEIDNMEVLDIEIRHKRIESLNFTENLEYKDKQIYEGTVYAYIS